MILIDGKKAAADLREELKKEVLFLRSDTSFLSCSLNNAASFFPSIKIINLRISLVRCRASYTFL